MPDTRGIFFGSSPYNDIPIKENPLTHMVQGMAGWSGFGDLPRNVVDYLNQNAGANQFVPGELRDTVLNKDLAEKLREIQISEDERNQRDASYRTGGHIGQLVDPVGNTIFAGLGKAALGSKLLRNKAGQIVLREGQTPEMFHGTEFGGRFSNAGIPSYDLGTHFGNLNQAQNRVVSSMDGLMNPGTNIRRNYLDDLEMNTVDMDDLGMWSVDDIMGELKKRDILDYDSLEKLQKKLDTLGFDKGDRSHSVIRKALLDNDISTIRYKNTAEGEGLSFIALDPEKQVKGVAGNKPDLQYLDETRKMPHAVRGEVPHLIQEYIERQGSKYVPHKKKILAPLSKEGKKQQAQMLKDIFADYNF